MNKYTLCLTNLILGVFGGEEDGGEAADFVSGHFVVGGGVHLGDDDVRT